MKGRPYQANRVLGVLSKMFNLAEVLGLRPDGWNACHHVPKFREKKRERFLSQAELPRLGATLEDCLSDGSDSPVSIATYRLLYDLPARIGKVQT